MKIPQYPQDFYDFSKGVDITDEEVNKWIKEGIEYLENHKDEVYYAIASGNTIIHISRYYYNDIKGYYFYDIDVAKSYANSTTYEDED